MRGFNSFFSKERMEEINFIGLELPSNRINFPCDSSILTQLSKAFYCFFAVFKYTNLQLEVEGGSGIIKADSKKPEIMLLLNKH